MCSHPHTESKHWALGTSDRQSHLLGVSTEVCTENNVATGHFYHFQEHLLKRMRCLNATTLSNQTYLLDLTFHVLLCSPSELLSLTIHLVQIAQRCENSISPTQCSLHWFGFTLPVYAYWKWERLPGAMVGAQSLIEFKKHSENSFRNMVWILGGLVGSLVLESMWIPSNSEYSVMLWFYETEHHRAWKNVVCISALPFLLQSLNVWGWKGYRKVVYI